MESNTIENNLQLRPATLADAELLLLWRNDPDTRRNSRTQGVIDHDSHIEWLKRSFQSSFRAITIATVNGTPIGMIRADRGGERTELSWALAPDMRGKGLGKYDQTATPLGEIDDMFFIVDAEIMGHQIIMYQIV